MTVLLANVRSIVKKRDSFNSLVDTCNADIIAITETWLHSNVHDAELYNNSSRFTTYRCDRTLRQGGGVLLAISKSIISYPINVRTELETVWAYLELGHRKIVVGVCYRPPNHPPNFVAELHDVINTVVTRHPTATIFLMGDFNFSNINWFPDGPTVTPFSSQSAEFLSLCSLFSLTQLVTQPTRITSDSANVLDLILTSHPDIASNISYLPPLSDHLSLSFDMLMPVIKTEKRTKRIRDYNKADFETINQELATFLDIFLQDFDSRSTEANWSIFKDKVNDLINKYVPLRTISSHSRAPWYTTYLKRLSNKKKRLYRAAKHSSSDSKWDAYKAANSVYVSKVKEAKKHFFQDTLPNMLLN